MSFRGVYKRVHFYLGNIYRLLTAIKYQKTIKISEACTIFGASFGDEGWHHIRQTLKEYDDNPDIDYRTTTLYFFLKYFTPDSICELIEGDKTSKCMLPLFVYPWGTFIKNEYISNKDPLMSRFCGPSSTQFIKDEFDRIISLYKQIKQDGYRPYVYGNSFIGGVFLKKKNGKRRFVVLQGNHRIAILAHLGTAKLEVRNVKGRLTKVIECNLSDEALIKLGKCTKRSAKKIFEMFFEQDGHHLLAFCKKTKSKLNG
jgi:hypothetical protein